MSERREYRTTRDFQIGSKDIFALLQTDLNGHNTRRAKAARETYEFISLLLAHDQKMEDKAIGRATELQRVKGQVEFLAKRVLVVSPEKREVVLGEDKEGDGAGN